MSRDSTPRERVLAGIVKEIDAKRGAANVELIQILAQYLTDHPGIRFGQALRNLNIVLDTMNPDGDIYWCNEFYLEPQELLGRVRAKAAEKPR